MSKKVNKNSKKVKKEDHKKNYFTRNRKIV